MAYEAPSTQSSGHVITATEWNQLVNDILASEVALVTTKGDLVAGTGTNALARTAVGVNGAYLVADSTQTNGIGWQAAPSVRLEKTSNQAITDATLTAVTFAAGDETYDTAGLHEDVTNPSRITVTTTGKYQVGAAAQFADDFTTGTYREFDIYKNGSNLQAQFILAPQPTIATQCPPISTLILMTAGDYVELKVKHDRGGNLNLEAATLWAVYQTR